MTTTERDTVLRVSDLAVHFGGLVAISNLNFTVRNGEILSLIGPNGAGKTTAFNVITGFLGATQGTVEYNGHSLNGLKPNQIADLGLVRTFQKTSVFGNETVFRNILIGLHRRSTAKAWEIILALPRIRREEDRLREMARQTLEFIGLAHRSEERADDLPYGEQRLLEVAVALAADPSILLLDEPASGMNPAETANFMKMVQAIRERGITILLIEHDMKMVMQISDRVIVLNQGEIIADGTPQEIQRNPEVIRAYLGDGAVHA